MDSVASGLVYGMCLFFPLIPIFFNKRFDLKSRIFVNLLIFFPTFIFAALRGYAGTDTKMYRDNFDSFRITSIFELSTTDPIFYFIQMIIKNSGGKFQTFALFQALFCWILFSIGAAKIDKSIPLFGVGLLPVLFVDATFNGMRYGMAFALTSVIILLIPKVRPTLGMLMAVIPGLIHSSMLIIMISTGCGILLLLLGIGIVVMDPRLIAIFQYFQYKASDYSEISRPSVFSGLFPIVQTIAIIFIARISKVPLRWGINLYCISILLALLSLVISYFSMSGLRLLQIAVFLLAISVSSSIERENITIKAKYLVLLIGILGVVNFLRQIFLVGPEGNVLFAPYDFF
ncbi:EpsG family protein [Janthinobacterium sp. 64]|uniref:EpsG family protein n=1 Tax=Janthinobacterium sp. 64 TaxID=2035208 RepID=UPI000C2CC96A|nr:EpsG family protein [Janthinobacterium sp. 64]PKB22445.1 EpsG-like putative glucosyltransferase [Janthinobacterium sp. 64]